CLRASSPCLNDGRAHSGRRSHATRRGRSSFAWDGDTRHFVAWVLRPPGKVLCPDCLEKMPRLFIAIPVPRALRERLAFMQDGIPGARWVKPENMHITLTFIGEVD